MGMSDIQGWGAFAGEPIKKDEYLGEYTGELVDQPEADRRGSVYDKEECSYLFNLKYAFVVVSQH